MFVPVGGGVSRRVTFIVSCLPDCPVCLFAVIVIVFAPGAMITGAEKALPVMFAGSPQTFISETG